MYKLKMKHLILSGIFLIGILNFVSADLQTQFPHGGDLETSFSFVENISGYFFPSDILSPVITIVEPTGDTITASTMTIYLSLDEYGLCNYSINNSANQSVPTTNNRLFTKTISTPQPNGNYLFEFYCEDFSGNRASNSIEIPVSIATTNETNTTTTTTTTTTGGGGGGASSTNKSFSINPDLLEVDIKTGDTAVYFVNFTNTGNSVLNFTLTSSNLLRNFLVLGDKTFLLDPGQSKRVSFGFFIRETIKSNFYMENVKINAGEIEKEIVIALDINERNPIFDILIDAPDRAYVGEKVSADIQIINMGDLEGFDLYLEYSILDSDRNVITSKEESLYVTRELNLKKKLTLPEGIEPGKYFFFAQVSYKNINAQGADSFEVSIRKGDFAYYIFIGIMILLVGLVLYILYKRRGNKIEKEVPIISEESFKEI